MRELNDWRLTNQEKYLKGVDLTWKSYHAPGPLKGAEAKRTISHPRTQA
jgi:hypothetical protein